MQRIPEERARRLAEDPIPRLLLRLCLPAVIGMMTAGIYNFVDRSFVGNAVRSDGQPIGPDGLAGVTLSLPVMFLLMATGMLIGLGSAALVSIKLGEKKHEEAERVLGNATVLVIAISAVVTVVGLIVLDPLLRITQISEQIRPYAHDFLQIIILGTGFQIVGYGLNAIIRAEGNSRTAMWTLLIGVILNLVLAYVFIFKFRWGVRGAAFATFLSQGVSATWVMSYFLRAKSMVRLRWKFFRFNWPTTRETLIIGSPMFAMQVATALMNGVLMFQLNTYGGDRGDLAIAVWGAIYSLMMMAAMPVFGINQGTQPAIGFNHGARRFDRVKKALLTGILYASVLTVGGFVAAMVFPAAVMMCFVDKQRLDPSVLQSVLDMGVPALRICFLASPLVGFQVVSASYFQATGKPREAGFLMLSRPVFFLIPLLWILPRYYGLNGVWAAIPCADLAASVLTGVCLWYELRRLDVHHAQTIDTPDAPILEDAPAAVVDGAVGHDAM